MSGAPEFMCDDWKVTPEMVALGVRILDLQLGEPSAISEGSLASVVQEMLEATFALHRRACLREAEGAALPESSKSGGA